MTSHPQAVQRKNGLENSARMFTANKINPEDSRNIKELSSSNTDSLNNAQNVTTFMGRRRWVSIENRVFAQNKFGGFYIFP
jgi:hypothetical protein